MTTREVSARISWAMRMAAADFSGPSRVRVAARSPSRNAVAEAISERTSASTTWARRVATSVGPGT
ncbi:MAG: hypothetical protein QM765_22655 [Myxococcales bacterium]